MTFLFTDVEGSTAQWMADRAAMAASLVVHDALVRDAIESHGGLVFSTGGDAFAAAFARASDAVAAALLLQDRLESARWPGPRLQVRIGIHLGEADERDGDYFGPVVSTAARVAAAGHGGQILITEAVRSTAAPPAAVDVGLHHLRDVPVPIHLFQLGDRAFPPLRVVDPASTNLPVRPTRLIGRDEEVSRIRQLLAEHRLVTITGVGGLGKTRVAIAVGNDELPHRLGGVWFADLTTVTGDDEVVGAVAKALGLTLHEGDPQRQVVQYLADKPALVIIDNCEHVIDGCAALASALLSAPGPGAFLATSREALAIDGEQAILLEPLAADDRGSPALRLFTERAAACDANFVLDDGNAPTVAAVCRRLDGIPLALELAAARVTMMTMPELEAALDDRFAVLDGGRQRQRQRHRQRTLQETLDWSYQLLKGHEQQMLRAVGVFVDGFDMEAAAAVAGVSRGEAFSAIEGLVAKSLVVRGDDGPRARFKLLETIKAYAEDRLGAAGEADAARDRHLEHFHGLATSYGHTGVADLRLGVRLRRDRGNLTAAFGWGIETGRSDLAADVITGSYPVYIVLGATVEARRHLDYALRECVTAASDRIDELRVAVIMTSAWLTDWNSYREQAVALLDSARPAARVLAITTLAVATPFADMDQRFTVERARAELAAARAAAVDPFHDVLDGAAHWVHGRLAAGQGDLATSLRECEQFFSACATVDFYPTWTPRAAKLAAVCQILLREAEGARRTVAWFEAAFGRGAFSIDDINALALIGEDRLADAAAVIRSYAQVALSGRVPGQVCDSAVLLAALAHAEKDDEQARHLLLHMGAGQEPGTIIYSRHLADELGIGALHAARQNDALGYAASSPEGFNGTRLASAVVKAELERRGWS